MDEKKVKAIGLLREDAQRKSAKARIEYVIEDAIALSGAGSHVTVASMLELYGLEYLAADLKEAALRFASDMENDETWEMHQSVAEKLAAVTISPYLGTGAKGAARKAALTKLARDAGHFYNGEPSIGRFLCDLADKAGTKPAERNLDDEMLKVIVHCFPQEFDALEDAILVRRLRAMASDLAARGIGTITGDSHGWAWMNYIIVLDPANDNAVFASLAECRVLLDTVREMKDPAAAFERWLPKVKEVRDE